MRVRCPDHARWDGDDLLGCGHEFEAEPDEEGFIDCPNCGMWFYPEESGALSTVQTADD